MFIFFFQHFKHGFFVSGKKLLPFLGIGNVCAAFLHSFQLTTGIVLPHMIAHDKVNLLFGKLFKNFALKLLSCAIGAVIYYLVISLVLRLGLESTDLKLLTALVVAAFLAIPYLKGKYFTKKGRVKHAQGR